MKENIKVALVQMETGPVTEKEQNIRYHEEKIRLLAKEGVELIIFPELSVSGYIQETTPAFKELYWKDGAESTEGDATTRIAKVAMETGTHVIFGLAESTCVPMMSYNSAVLVGPEGFIGVNRKVNLPLLEKDYFIPGTKNEVFQTSLGKIGSIICYELFFPEPSRLLSLQGAEIIVFIGFVALRTEEKGGGVGFGEEKMFLFNYAPRIRALENQVHFLACTAGGPHYMGERLGYWGRAGQSKIVDNLGNLVALSEKTTEDVVIGTITNDTFIKGRAAYPMLQDRHPESYQQLIMKDF